MIILKRNAALMRGAVILLVLTGVLSADVRTAFQPLGSFDADLMLYLKKETERVYPFCRIEILPSQPLPASAFYAPRNRWRADKLLTSLSASAPSGVRKIIGLTEKDISASKGQYYDWGIFGLGDIGRKPSVVSIFRLKKAGTSRDLFRRRAAKVVVHELGHTLGLAHCSDPRCIMTDAKGLIKTFDAAQITPCRNCMDLLDLMNYK